MRARFDIDRLTMRPRTVGRFAGVPVSVHPAVGLLALILIVQEGLLIGHGALGFLLALLLVVLLFAAVLLHEAGHALMALHYGLEVSDISLSPLGGASRIERLPRHSIAETLIALSGPLVNLAIAVALLPVVVLFGFLAGYSSFGDVTAGAFRSAGPLSLLLSFFILNLLLLMFNVLPAFPMDGGRILRAILARRVGRETGTQIAVIIGQVLGGLLVLSALVWQLWALIVVGVFVVIAAQAEVRQVRLEGAMRRLHVGAYALWENGGLSPASPLTVALRGGPRDSAVTENGRVVGMVWRYQLLHDLQGGAGQRTVADVMDTMIVTADMSDSVYDVEQWMQQADRWAIPVVDERGFYRGIFTADRFVHVRRHVDETAGGPPRWLVLGYDQLRTLLRRLPGS